MKINDVKSHESLMRLNYTTIISQVTHGIDFVTVIYVLYSYVCVLLCVYGVVLGVCDCVL